MSDWNASIIEEFRDNGGTVSTNGFGRALVLVHHIGAKSGVERINPVAAIPQDDGSWLIAASAAGADRNPDWYHNLLAHPQVTIEKPDDGGGTSTVAVTAVDTAEGRDAAWAQFTAMSDGFKGYEAKTSRVIPVLRLVPRSAD
ncbi:nitroreductase/quinone reductase family protein [Allobranchiibius huperziae]|uniref:Deazaflavin-dependent oxidoreductase (Nitroreductase family) n=1 Tax=Allobranchiibius huperziae TaxID=1874116 RepID=A0A853DBK2_9MICO|nr:nitroreductase/quinone reductase family protein [Allobranchiibius huperziae]NYJ73977.1 deazaflavin-dependent oxidoreductase (nitroreductase family) [Allobranchiibius huperziae]